MGGDYVHGFSPAEMDRLTRMQAIVNDAELAALDLSEVRSVIDVGSGLGQMTRALARALGPGARVLGIEREARQREEAERQAREAGEAEVVEFRAGNALRLPLTQDERGSFDLAHARFVLEHVADPLGVVREMVSAVRPGGRVVLLDDDHELLRFWPPCPPAESAWQVYWESYRERGLDPLVGRRGCELLQRAGATPVRATTVFFGAVHGSGPFDLVVDNWIGVVVGAGLDRSGHLDPTVLREALEAVESWRRDPAATLWYSLPLVEGVREA
jgi:SAM-dependent methyltransferase